MIEKFKNPEFLWNTFAQVIQMIGALLIIKLLSVYLSKGEFGIYVLLNSILALFMILPFNAIIHGVARHVHEYNTTSKYKDFFSISYISQALIFVIIMIITLITIQFFEFDLKEYIPILLVLIFSEIIKTTIRTIENTNRKRKKIAIASLLEFTSKIFIIYLSQVFNIISIETILYIIIFGNFLSILILMFNNYSNIQLKISKESIIILTPMIIFALPLIASQLFGWVRDMSSRWIIQSYMDNESVAIFALMATLAAIVPNGVYSLLGSYIVPILYQKEESEKGYTKKTMIFLIPKLFLGTIILFIPIYFLQEYIIIILSDIKYVEHSWMLPYMFFVFSTYIISMVASYNIYVSKQTKSLIYPSLYSAIVAFVSGMYFINNYGLIGALVSYALTYLTYSFIIFYLVFKKGRELVC